MKTKHVIMQAALLVLILAFSLQPSAFLQAAPLGTAFTYQGSLTDGGNPTNGSYDLKFILFDDPSGGSAVAGAITNSLVGVTNGLFTTTLDFEADVFTGDARWLEIAVRPSGGGAFTPLVPRQLLTPTPYALHAANASKAASAVTASNVVAGSISTAALALDAVDSSRVTDGTLTAADLSTALASNTFWRLGGNAGTAAGVNFLGTTDNQALELKVNSQRALRLEPSPAGIPNLVVTMRASGGYRLFSNPAASVGVSLAAGGNAWSAMSDRKVKENLRPVNPLVVLEKLTALPVTEWNLVSQDPSIWHLGPMAQDFQAAFGLGEDDRHISSSDAGGVARAAIQGLNQKLEEKNAALAREVAELKALVRALAETVNGGGQ